MDNRIDNIHVAPTSERRAEPGRFGQALRTAATTVANGLASGVALAAPYVPGGTVLSAAVRGAVSSPSRPAGATVAASLASGTAATGAAGTSTGAGGDGDILEATRALQQEAQVFNVQYLQLQESMQRESREFTALSNVMKVKHDSAKAAINNIH
ncbi:MAG TPA: hypothetical protein VLU43_17940 [Anaeromyxobacteraceae bacterium]|nr:hypothetical protein [Anaeromyxobacteraceae bacterium]